MDGSTMQMRNLDIAKADEFRDLARGGMVNGDVLEAFIDLRRKLLVLTDKPHAHVTGAAIERLLFGVRLGPLPSR